MEPSSLTTTVGDIMIDPSIVQQDTNVDMGAPSSSNNSGKTDVSIIETNDASPSALTAAAPAAVPAATAAESEATKTNHILHPLPSSIGTTRPVMISIGEHEAILARDRERLLDRERSKHATIVRKMEKEIERLKDLLKSYKISLTSSLKRTNTKNKNNKKRKASQEELVKGGSSHGSSGGNKKNKKDGRDTDHDGSAAQEQQQEGRMTQGSIHDARWLARLEELKAYKDIHGHCHIDCKNEGMKELRLWCQTQRQMHQKLVKGLATTLTAERIRLLNGICFKWSLKKTDQLKWDERFEQLKQYHTRHGHVRIPQKDNESPGLGNWVLEQRRRYRELALPESERKIRGSLTQDQIDKLLALGFEWSVKFKNVIGKSV